MLKQKRYTSLIIDIRGNVGGTTRLNDVLFEYITGKPVTSFSKIETRVSREKKKDFVRNERRYAGGFRWYNYLYYPIYIRTSAKRKEIMTARNGTTLTTVFRPEKPKYNPLQFKGKSYLLMGKKTYSAAACLAAGFKTYHVGTVVGRETGEPTCFTGDWVAVTLPNTKLQCAISSKRFILAGAQCDGHGVRPDYDTSVMSVAGDGELDVEVSVVGKLVKGE